MFKWDAQVSFSSPFCSSSVATVTQEKGAFERILKQLQLLLMDMSKHQKELCVQGGCKSSSVANRISIEKV